MSIFSKVCSLHTAEFDQCGIPKILAYERVNDSNDQILALPHQPLTILNTYF